MATLLQQTLRYGLTLSSGLGKHKRLFILIYHRVLPEPDFMHPGEPDRRAFTWQMALLAGHFNVLPLDVALARLTDGTLPSRAVAITFDDGYADNLHQAVPILKQFGLPATFFIASDFLDGGLMWNDRIIETVRSAPGTSLDLEHLGLGRFSLADAVARMATSRALLQLIKHREPETRLRLCAEIGATAAQLPTDLMLTSAELRALHRQGMEIGGHTLTA